MQIVNVQGDADYPVYIGAGLLKQIGGIYRQRGLPGRALIISDETVIEHYGQSTLDSLKANDIESITVAVPPGEGSKTLEMANQLYERLICNRFQRDAVVIALGGGVVGDLAGFVAATFLRGVKLVQVPTTLLAQVDSAIGGKTGINHRLGKNLIGAFYPPVMVVADLNTLGTLPARQWRSGMAEVLKYGLIADRALFDELEGSLEQLLNGSGQLESLVTRCVQIKAEVVAKDEREAGLRKILNFGHTLGHALESISDYQRFHHGEAILWGMLGEAYLSYRFGHLPEMEFVRVQRLLSRVEKPPLPDLEPGAFLDHVRRDKKNQDGRVHVVWLRHIGACQAGPIDNDALLSVLGFWDRETKTQALKAK